jgi:hypothetical protein
MYILYSIVISAVIFGVYHYFDSISRDNKDTNDAPYDVNKDLLTINNILIYILIVSIVFFVIYMAFSDDLDIFTTLGIYDNDYNNNSLDIKKTNINPAILRNFTDPMKMGFEPYNSGGSKSSSDSDTSSVISSVCSADSE